MWGLRQKQKSFGSFFQKRMFFLPKSLILLDFPSGRHVIALAFDDFSSAENALNAAYLTKDVPA
jgi:hypothetical protein